jgi:Mn-dependent DtxR family transcriptional regulator
MSEPKPTKLPRVVSSRWTPALAKAGWTPVVNFFLDNYHRLEPEPLRYVEAMFVIHLMRHKWDGNAPYPGFRSLAKRMGISPQSARIYARKLQTKGYLVREFKTGETNRFHLKKLFEALETLAVSDAKQKVRLKEARKIEASGDDAPAEKIVASRQRSRSRRKPTAKRL